MKTRCILFAAAFAAGASAIAMETVNFASTDGLLVTADLYAPHPKTVPFIILFHQADYSRGEYREIAPRLNALGFNAMAVDQRSGNAAGGVRNETAALARGKSLKRSYIDALPDMLAAIAFAKAQGYVQGGLVLWGSSYSASLVLKIAGDEPGICDAVLAFSPGEYFSGTSFIRRSAANIAVPVFVSSAPGEGSDWSAIFAAIPGSAKASFLPEALGRHGSSALMSQASGNGEYWKHVEAFLASLKK